MSISLGTLALAAAGAAALAGGAVAGVAVLNTSGPWADKGGAEAQVAATPTPTAPAAPGTPAEQGTVTTLAGGPHLKGPPRDGPATSARFGHPSGVAFDRAGNMYIADFENRVVLRLGRNGQVTRVAGSGEQGVTDGPALLAEFYSPTGVAVGPDGSVYVSEAYGHRVRKIDPAGFVTTVAGGGLPGLSTGTFRDGAAAEARFDGVSGIAIDASGNIIAADYNNNRIRRVTPTGEVSTIAGTGESGAKDGPALQATFNFPAGLALGPDGSIYLTEHGNNDVRRISPDGHVSTLVPYSTPGTPQSLLSWASGIAVSPTGEVYVADTQGFRIVHVNADGTTTPIAGGGQPGFADGKGPIAAFSMPTGMAWAPDGSLAVVDGNRNAAIRRIEVK